MRQAILLEPTDLVALREGTPLTIQVGSIEVLVLMSRSARNNRRNGTRRQFTDAERRRLLAEYDKAPVKGPFLRQHHLSSSMIPNWRKLLMARGKTHA